MQKVKGTLIAVLFSVAATAWAQSPKELTTKTGMSVVLLSLVNARPDCSANPGPVAIPIISSAPANGTIQMQVTATDVAASANCPARKVPSIALFYTSNKDFAGLDAVQIDVQMGNEKRSLSYRVTVHPVGQQL